MTQPNQSAIGHNNPPSEIEILKEKLRDKHAPLLDDARELVQKAKDNLPNTITDDEVCGQFTDLIKDIGASIKKLESARTAEKEPFLAGGRAVDSFFKIVTDTLEKSKRAANVPVTDYLNQKAAAERRRLAAEAEEKRKAAEAQLQAAVELEDVGMTKQSDNNLVKAEVNNAQAAKLEVAAQARPAELSQTRGSSSMASLRTTWVGTITNFDELDKVTLSAFIPQEVWQKALNAYVRAEGRKLAGAYIYEESIATTR